MRYHLKCCVIVNALIECKIAFSKVVRQSLKSFYSVHQWRFWSLTRWERALEMLHWPTGGKKLWCGSRYFNQWIWAKNLKSVKTFRKSLVTYMKRFEDNNHVFSVRLCLPEAIFWLRGEMVGQKWVKSEIHHFSIVGYNSPIKCAIWVHNTILETSGHLLFSSKPENGQKWPKISTWRHPSRKPKNWPSSANLENLHVYCFFFGFFTLNPFKINEYIAICAHNYVIQPFK